MPKREGPLWDAMEAAVEVIDRNQERMREDAAWNADVTPVVDLAKRIVEQCAAIAEKTSGYVSADESFERGYDAGRKDAAKEIRKLIE